MPATSPFFGSSVQSHEGRLLITDPSLGDIYFYHSTSNEPERTLHPEINHFGRHLVVSDDLNNDEIDDFIVNTEDEDAIIFALDGRTGKSSTRSRGFPHILRRSPSQA